MATSIPARPRTRGGSFLIESTAPEHVFTPEDFSAEHRAIARTAEEFWARDVTPELEKIWHQDYDAALRVVRKSAELGLTAVLVPEQYGGMELDMTSAMIVAEGIAKDGSYAAWHGAHAGIGTLPVLLFGTEAQKERYLPKLCSAEWIGAYALTEPHAGSDALAARTRADLNAAGTHYTLHGSKMWITNAGKADLFTVFARIGGEKEKFTAFLVERSWPGVSVGAEEKKMGIKGSSTCAVYFDNVQVPVDSVLGEIGRGHVIAFNILNIGRLKLGPFAVGGAKDTLRVSTQYAKDRQAFGVPIASFGMMQHKLAEMYVRIFAAESMCYRVTGLIESHLQDWNWAQPGAAQVKLKAIEEFAAECSFVKVYASEMLDYVVDEGVQIHGGYGYHADYAVERAYRDSRINRIFEGTNEINRLLAAGMLLKRAMRGQLALVEAVKRLQDSLLAAPAVGEPDLIANAKSATLLALGVAFQRYREGLEQQQEILASLADCAMHAFALESVLLRVQRLSGGPKADLAADLAAVYSGAAIRLIEDAARNVITASSEGDAMRTHLAALRRFVRCEPVDAVAARRRIAARLLASGGKPLF